MKPVPCPHCGKPLEVVWELYRSWSVEKDDAGTWLSGGLSEFEGGTCEACGQWVGEEDLANPDA